MPGLVRRRVNKPTQIGQIKQPHLHTHRWLPRRQPHLSLKERFCADANAQNQHNETADKRFHKVKFLYIMDTNGSIHIWIG